MILYELDAINEQYFSPYTWRILMSLNHKGLYEDVKRVPVKFSEKSEINNKGFNTVPVLNDNGTWTGESLQIAKYLELILNRKTKFKIAKDYPITWEIF